MTERFDVVVVGAGLSGRLTALALSRRGFSVLLCDARTPAIAKGDPRSTALGYASARALHRLGVWDGVGDDAGAVRDILVSHATAPGLARPGARGEALGFDESLLPEQARWDGTPLAYVVPNARLADALATACDGTEMTQRFGTPLTGTSADQGGATLRFEDGHTVRATLVVACDGRRSRLRRAAGIRTVERDFRQDALTMTVGHTEPHGGTARQLFLPGGPLAALPLRGDRSSLVWSLPRATAAALADEPERLLGMAMRHLPELGTLSASSDLARFPLGLTYATTLASQRLALVGEAGRAIHPLAGQGYNVAVADAAALADVLAEARALGLDHGHGTVLSRYDEWRRADATLMAFGTTALAGLLSTGERLTRSATALGFGLVSRSEWLRARLARRAGGAAGRVPSLMAGEA